MSQPSVIVKSRQPELSVQTQIHRSKVQVQFTIAIIVAIASPTSDPSDLVLLFIMGVCLHALGFNNRVLNLIIGEQSMLSQTRKRTFFCGVHVIMRLHSNASRQIRLTSRLLMEVPFITFILHSFVALFIIIPTLRLNLRSICKFGEITIDFL